VEELVGVPWLAEILNEGLPSIVLNFSISDWGFEGSECGAGALREELCAQQASVTRWALAEEALLRMESLESSTALLGEPLSSLLRE
jgi:hypothetical protein